MKKAYFLLMLPLIVLGGCGDDPVRVGSKAFTENRILAELIAQVIEAEGIPVELHPAIGDTPAVFEALRTDRIDIYPEYSGTALALLGLPVSNEPDADRALAEAEFDRFGIEIGAAFGFDSRFAVVMSEGATDPAGIAAISDLAERGAGLTLAVTEAFARRPVDGLAPLLDRYGLTFGDTIVLPEGDRARLVDLLIDGDADVAVMLENDTAIADFGLVELVDDAGFFPSYRAFPLVGRQALDTHPGLAGALAKLAGQLDAATISDLVAQVELSGRSVRNVARDYLLAREIVPGTSRALTLPELRIAIDPADIGTPMANEVLRAARQTVPNRIIRFHPDSVPIASLLDETARIAVAPAASLFIDSGTGATSDERLETIAAVGSYFVHALARSDGPADLGDAQRIATGPPGSAAHRLGLVVAALRDPAPEIVALGSADATEAAAALAAGRAEVALLVAPLRRPDIAAALAGDPSLRLVPASAWWQGAARPGQPYLRAAIIPAGAYPTDGTPVETLAMQSVVVGPAPPSAILGHQGPVTYTEAPRPITDATVRAFNENLGDNPDVNPLLRPSAALQPRPDPAMQPLNRTPAYTVFSLLIMAFIGWAIWLLTRPLNRAPGHD